MIETLSIRNFKVLREVDVRLRPLTLIVGPNSSGKSSILEAFSRVAEADKTAEEMDELRSRDSSGEFLIRVEGRHRGALFQAKVPGDLPQFLGQGNWPSKPTELRLERQKLSAISGLSSVSLMLPPDGEGLATILAGFALELPGDFQRLQERLRAVVPTVERVWVTRQMGSHGVGYALRFDMRGAEGISAFAISEGTLLTLGLLTALSAPDRSQLVLIDDLERGLHPRALGELIQLLRKIQEQDPELQIVATSHSPYLLDHLEAEEILLTALDEDGYAVVRSLAEHPDYERWKDVMAPGEFWSTVGESWVTAAKK